MGIILELKHVAKAYGRKAVLRDVSCALESGSVNLLTGRNGSGKSTLMRLMAGLARPTRGTIRRPKGDAPIGYVAHATFLYPNLTALENLAFWNRAAGMSLSEGDIRKGLDRVGLGPYANERAGCFSRGMAQRLNLARLLLQSPRLWLLDEPGTGLDIESLATLRTEIAAARDDGVCVVLITHDPEGDGPLADRRLTLEEGRLADAAAAEDSPC